MRTLYSVGILALGITVAASVSCGGDSESTPFAAGTGGSGGSSGASGAAGSGGSSGAAGTAGSGGSSGASGTAGSGGSAGDAAACAPPTDSSRAALCLSFGPEVMAFESDPRLDGNGILVVQIYNTPQPGGTDGGPAANPLMQTLYPPQPDSGTPATVSVTQLPELRFDNLPATVYVRAFFADNFEAFDQNDTTWGVWLGGYNLAGGLVESPPLQSVQLTPGTGRAHTMPMIALRRLRATLTLAAGVNPLDDGEGPGSVVAVRQATSLENLPVYGAAAGSCVRVGPGGNATLTGVLIGSGTFYLVGGLDDFNLRSDFPPGSLVSLDVAADGGTSLPATSRVDVAPTAYTVTHTVPLNLVVPLGDGGTPAPYACPAADAGSD